MVKPYKENNDSKKEQVTKMFDTIAPKYDFLNHFLSLGIDRIWRRKAVRFLKKHHPKLILDVASGTGDFAIESSVLRPERIDAIDISVQMLKIAERKIKEKQLVDLIFPQPADAEHIPFQDHSFHAITIAFGVRNFENLQLGLQEMNRVLMPEGVVTILEFSMPQNPFIRVLYNYYFSYILPFFGRIISKDTQAYTYLPESVKAFPERDSFLRIMESAGFRNCEYQSLSFGIACLYIGYK